MLASGRDAGPRLRPEFLQKLDTNTLRRKWLYRGPWGGRGVGMVCVTYAILESHATIAFVSSPAARRVITAYPQ
jgi:hypothetical protein